MCRNCFFDFLAVLLGLLALAVLLREIHAPLWAAFLAGVLAVLCVREGGR